MIFLLVDTKYLLENLLVITSPNLENSTIF